MKINIFSSVIFTFAFVLNINAQALLPIAEIQGEGFRSTSVGKTVKTQGIVTGIRKGGFYIQTPDDKIDGNPNTSEGLYIYTQTPPSDSVKIGNLVEVAGEVTEYRAAKELYGLFVTEIIKPDVKIISEGNVLPKPVILTKNTINPKGNVDQMEKFEGMRVQIDELTVAAPTAGYENRKEDKIVSDGVFFGVIGNTPRAFREPGLDVLTVIFDKLPQTLPIFDMNPEMLRIDSDGMNGGVALDMAAGAKIKNVVGIIDYAYQRFTLLIDFSVKPTIENDIKALPTSPAGEREITVGSFNLENFFDDETNSDLPRKETKVSAEHFRKRLKKASIAIREVLSMPDVLGVIEMENLVVLKKLAKKINEDAVAAKQPDPKYVAYLEESNDFRGIDVGFLIKTAKVSVVKSEQLARDIKLDHKDANPKERLFDRPPLLMQLTVPDEKTGGKFEFTVIVNHFKSYLGISDPKDGDRVQNKRRLEAEYLAKFIVERQKLNPNEKLIVMGDFNAFQFNDGYNDLIGILKGKPERNIITPSQDIYNTELINMVEYISPENRYSYVYGGNAQVLDHILINKPTVNYAVKFGYARFNADFPEVLANDENRPERISDHDAPVLYLSMDAKNDKKEDVKSDPKK